MYLEYCEQDIGVADVGIVEGRYRTIVTHFNQCLDYVIRETKVSDLGINTLVDYVRENEETSHDKYRSRQKASTSKIRNEMATINACQRYLYDSRKVASFPRFVLPQMPKHRYEVNEELVRRQTFEREEYEKALAEEKKEALKALKKNAIAEVKKLIVEYKLTKVDIT